MIRIGRQLIIQAFYIIIDLLIFSACIYTASLIRQSTLPFEVTVHNLFFDAVNPFRYIIFFWMLVIVIINNSNRLYQTRREIYETIEVLDVVKAVLLSALIVIVSIFVFKIADFPRSILILTTIFNCLTFSLWRVCKRIFVEYLVTQGYNNFNALVVGAGKVGTALAREITQRPNLGIKVVGFLDDYKTETQMENGPQILGKLSDFVSISRREFINKIFITIHPESKKFLQLLEEAKEHGVAVRVIPQGYNLMPSEFSKYNIGFIPIIEYCDAEIIRRQVGKRLFDIAATIMLTTLLLPALCVIAVMIKVDSPGPIFYKSRRFGRSGRPFYMLKFRSMVVNADKVLENYLEKNEVDGPIFKMKNDPRITKIGKILRKYSFDELPQVFNVLKGDMSLVGPRPLPIEQVQREDLKQLRRLEVRPGITGLWQVRGRSDISFSRLVRWDVWYINNWSFWLDINILLQTIPAVFKGKGAY